MTAMRNLLTIFSFLDVCLRHVRLTCMKTENWKLINGNGNVVVKMLIPIPSYSFPLPCTPPPHVCRERRRTVYLSRRYPAVHATVISFRYDHNAGVARCAVAAYN